MRAVWLKEFGGPCVLLTGQAPDPVAGPGQVLVDVKFANITFVETQLRSGGPGPFTPALPMIPGNGVGGAVVALGEGVGGELVGRRVVTNLKGSGGYAERAVVSATGWRSTMRSRYSRMAGRLGLLRAAAPRSGERVLIEAAAGGVGSLLVQLARNAGATVVALAGGARKVEFAAELGAHHAIDYSAPGWAEQVGDAVGAVDVVFDGVGGEIGEIAFDLLDRGGPLFSYQRGVDGGFRGAAAARGVTVRRGPLGTPEQLRAFTEAALAEAAAGTVKPVMPTLPLDQAATAHRAIESRASVGKTLLFVP